MKQQPPYICLVRERTIIWRWNCYSTWSLVWVTVYMGSPVARWVGEGWPQRLQRSVCLCWVETLAWWPQRLQKSVCLCWVETLAWMSWAGAGSSWVRRKEALERGWERMRGCKGSGSFHFNSKSKRQRGDLILTQKIDKDLKWQTGKLAWLVTQIHAFVILKKQNKKQRCFCF